VVAERWGPQRKAEPRDSCRQAAAFDEAPGTAELDAGRPCCVEVVAQSLGKVKENGEEVVSRRGGCATDPRWLSGDK